MAISNAFLTTCRTAIDSLTELTAYRAATAALDTAGELDKRAKWTLAYNDAQTGGSPALRLRMAIRSVVAGQDLSALSIPERETAYQTLAGIYLRDDEKPPTPAEEVAALTELVAAGLTD